MQLLPAFVVKDQYYYILNAEPQEWDAARGTVNFGMRICGTNNPDLNKDGVPKLSEATIKNLETNTIQDKIYMPVDERRYVGNYNNKIVDNSRYGEPRINAKRELCVNTLTHTMYRRHNYGERYVNTCDNFEEKGSTGYAIPVNNGEILTNAYYQNGSCKFRTHSTLEELLTQIEATYPGYLAKLNTYLNEDIIL